MTDDVFDAATARVAEYAAKECQRMARQMIAEFRIPFSPTTLGVIIRCADGGVPGLGETRRIASAFARWERAGRRDRLARRVG